MSTKTASDNVVLSTLFQDAMDPTRFIRIKTEKNDSVDCKVFFGDDPTNLVYHGTVEFKKRLFDFDGRSRIGFNPYKKPEEREDRRERRYNNYDDY